jgi:hypothetical protein
MKVLVCGSRKWSDWRRIAFRLMDLPVHSTIIHGGARGADSIAAEHAERMGHTVLPPFLPDYERFGRAWAPKARNLLMLEQKPDLVIAFQRNGSRGTQHTIDEARRRGIAVEVHTA